MIDRATKVCAAVLALGAGVAPVAAQDEVTPPPPKPTAWTEEMVPLDPFAAPAPFGPGEHLVYKVKVGVFNAGYGYMSVLGTEDIRENPTYRVTMGLEGGIGPLRVDDQYLSWMDVSTFQSWRYIRDVDQPGYEARRHYEFYPETMIWEREDNGESGPLGSALPMDEIAFMYFIRSLELEVGKSYTIPRYFKDDGNPVTIEVLRREQKEVEGVVYNTIVVRPIIQTDGLFSEGGEAEVYLTDDERRIMVYLKSNIPKFPGSLTLTLQSVQEGFPLNPAARKRILEARETRVQENGSDR
jgi:hypothetical protein